MARGPVCPGELREWPGPHPLFRKGTRMIVLFRAFRSDDDRTCVGLLAQGTCNVVVVSLEVATSMMARLQGPPSSSSRGERDGAS